METAMREKSQRRQRGSGSIYRPKFRDRKTGELRECSFFWIQYQRYGSTVRENTHSDKITVAREILKKRIGEIANGSWVSPVDRKITVSELIDSLFSSYRVDGIRSLEKTEQRWKKHLEPIFGKMRAIDLGTDALNSYIAARKQEDAENATINRELAIVSRAFYLAFESKPKKVYEIPPFPRLEENPARSGFVNDEQYKKLCDHCSDHWLRAILALAYSFGFRKGELLNLRVRQIDLLSRTLTLNAGETKNGEGRSVTLTNETSILLCQSVLGKQSDDFVFTWRDGRRVKDFRRCWTKLITAAGCPQLLFHDLRRSAVRNMIRRGIPQVTAMRISGHKTIHVFNRYNIVDGLDLADAAVKIEAGREAVASFALTLPNASQNQQKPAN